jgi:hypothetical protein
MHRVVYEDIAWLAVAEGLVKWTVAVLNSIVWSRVRAQVLREGAVITRVACITAVT